MKELKLNNNLDQPIFATLFEPENSNGKLTLINSATGVKQQVYFKISQYFAENGFTVLNYDYSGIGLSKPKDLKKSESSMRSWGVSDYKTLTDFIKINYPDFEKYLIGHSVGALILGMNEDSKLFKSFVFISTQKAFVGHLKSKIKILGYLGFGIVQPLTTKLFGYFPAHRFGLGESLPKNVAFDWRKLILNKKSTNALLEKVVQNYSKDLSQKVLVFRAEDDEWLTKKGVENLLVETFPNLKPTYKTLKISDSPKMEIGHINFFRSYNKPLWNVVLEEFEK
ncbi:alpha/beta hydrolase family protein [Halpernia frigidisoli]|uniref:Predicted alpha/beta hydrolase n=1 Tax=Halpernia frigidisoli TaxID=1125876 RepID=A0A1I3FPS0_9FLAO|nr:alpha/beta hydrolase [Halpernia frigidisoli]SFI13245.1 Predicted alpha/beta hydrolase [Halpernia frigidisoli]